MQTKTRLTALYIGKLGSSKWNFDGARAKGRRQALLADSAFR